MKINYYSSYESMSRQACDLLVFALEQNPGLLLCTATGNSPLRTYELLAEEYQQQSSLFSQLRILKLDEWGGIDEHDPQSSESFIRRRLIAPLHVSEERYFSFSGNAEAPEEECSRLQEILSRQGPIDLCVLGLGRNGHLGFNEPAEALMPHAHIAQLSPDTLQHSMVQAMQRQPTYGLTLGMADILQARRILLLVTGSGKKAAIEKLLEGRVTTHLPASLLWLHPDVECLIDERALG